MVKQNKKLARTLSRRKKRKPTSAQQKKSSQEKTLQQALALHQSGRLPEAESLYRQILLVEPDNPDALHFFGVLAHQVGKDTIAVELIRKAIHSRPDYAEAYYNLGIALYAQGKLDAAAESYRKALALRGNYVEAHYNLGIALKDLGKLDEAIKSFRKAIGLKPDYIEAYHNLGVTFSESGRLDDAIASYRKTLSLKPDFVPAYKGLSLIQKYTEPDDVIRSMETLYNTGKISYADRIDLGFSLGKIYEDIREYDKAFAYIAAANRVKRNSYKYSIQNDREIFERIKITFSPGFFASRHGSGSKDGTPIFIIGMPRSGTTLVEQILSSHPLVFGAGELAILTNLTNSICTGAEAPKFPECMQVLSQDALKRIGTDYIEKIREYSKDAVYITDKMPNNFLRVGLIKVILPAAKIIHCVRNPMDTCFSIFKTDFTVTHGYAYDMVELGHYYNLYQDLMTHWEKVLPGFMHTIRYEDLISDQLGQTRTLLDFCNLPWDEACMAFHRSKRRVRTVSLAQVRQPIYNDSVALWQRYEKQLEQLKKTLYG